MAPDVMGLTDKNPPCMHVVKPDTTSGQGRTFWLTASYFSSSLSGLFSCKRLGESCSVAGVSGVAEDSCDLSIWSASERGKYRTDVAGSLRLEALSASFPGSISHSHVFFPPQNRGRIWPHTRDPPKRVLQPCAPAIIDVLSGCYGQRFVRPDG